MCVCVLPYVHVFKSPISYTKPMSNDHGILEDILISV